MCDWFVKDMVDDSDAAAFAVVSAEDPNVVGLAKGGVLTCVVVDVVAWLVVE